MRNPTLVAAAAAALVFSGCAALGNAARAVVDPPKVTFDGLELDALDLEGFTLGLRWNVDNPNSFPFRMSRLGWQLQLDGSDAARGDTTQPIDVPAQGVAPVSILVRIRWSDLPGLLQLALNRDDLPFKVSGTAAVGSTFGTIDVPFSREGRLTFPRNFRLDPSTR